MPSAATPTTPSTMPMRAFGFPFFFGVSTTSKPSSAAPSPSGFGTVKRYLHLGQSILRPMRLAPFTSTSASQLGHGVLKLPAMGAPASDRTGIGYGVSYSNAGRTGKGIFAVVTGSYAVSA